MTSGTPENVLFLSTLGILQIIKEAQQQHGLRHDNYQRYRSYCSRKLRRLRKSLHITNTHKQRNFQQKKFTIDNVAGDSRHLLVTLFEAERCWAYAEQLKQETANEAQNRKSFQVLNKLRRAIKHSQTLEDLCKADESKVDAATKLEAQAYNSWLNGCLNIALKQYKEAVGFLNASKIIYDKLSKAASADPKVSAENIYQQRYQEIIAPQLRFCYMNLSGASPINDTGDVDLANSVDLEKLLAQAREKQVEHSKFDVIWCRIKINVSNAPTKVKTFVANLKLFDKQIEETNETEAKVALYEQLLVDCRDAIQSIRDENKEENFKLKRTVDNDGDLIVDNENNLSEQQNLYFWLTSVRLSKTVDKYLLLIGAQLRQPSNNCSKGDQSASGNASEETLKCSKPQDLVRLYDTILQNLNEILSLPGVNRDPTYVSNIKCQIAYFTTFRCFYISEVFSSQKKWREALALYERCLEHLSEARECIKAVKSAENVNVKQNLLDDLDKVIHNGKYTAHANCLVVESNQQQPVQPAAQANQKTYIEDLTTYRRLNPQEIIGPKKSVHVTRIPPDFRPMPCKPVFFDLALNHLSFPSLESKMDTAQDSKKSGQQKSSEESKGLGGLMKGWFWGGKS